MESRDQPRRVPGASRTPLPLNPAAPLPLNTAAPVPLNAAAPIPLNQAASVPTSASTQLTLRMHSEAEEPAEAPITVRKTYSWLISAITHLLLILILGLWTLSNKPEPAILLTVETSPEIEEEEPDFETLDLEGAPADSSAPIESEAPVVAAMEEPPEFTTASLEPALWTEGLPLARKVGPASAGNGTAPGAGYDGLGFGDKLKSLNKQGLDLVIVFDCTISMNTEIDNVKQMMTKMGAGLVKKLSGARISLVAYRDENDEFTHVGIPLTNNVADLNRFLEGITAGGGGDEPEGVEFGMQSGVADNEFRAEAHKMMLIFGDAPPHREKIETCVSIARKFKEEQAGRVCTITCGKREPLEAFEQIAEAGRGEALTMQDRGRIFSEILVSVFGGEHREDVVEYFGLDDIPGRKRK